MRLFHHTLTAILKTITDNYGIYRKRYIISYIWEGGGGGGGADREWASFDNWTKQRFYGTQIICKPAKFSWVIKNIPPYQYITNGFNVWQWDIEHVILANKVLKGISDSYPPFQTVVKVELRHLSEMSLLRLHEMLMWDDQQIIQPPNVSKNKTGQGLKQV